MLPVMCQLPSLNDSLKGLLGGVAAQGSEALGETQVPPKSPVQSLTSPLAWNRCPVSRFFEKSVTLVSPLGIVAGVQVLAAAHFGPHAEVLALPAPPALVDPPTPVVEPAAPVVPAAAPAEGLAEPEAPAPPEGVPVEPPAPSDDELPQAPKSMVNPNSPVRAAPEYASLLMFFITGHGGGNAR